MSITRFALLFVVFLDVMSQGLVIPILTTILLNPDQGFLPSHTTSAVRQFDFGLIMGIFFFSWFLGAAYISKLSDFVGRRTGILICLSGNLLGYILTIVALNSDSLVLLAVARAVSGFTAGNQPIAQAALIDLSKTEQQKTRLMGFVLAALSFGLVVGPLIGGLLSDKQVIGSFASLTLPFYAVSALVVLNILLIIVFFREPNFKRQPVHIRPVEVFLTLWEIGKNPTILRLSLIFFFAQLAVNSFFVFMSNYYFTRFHFDTLQNAIALCVLGVSMGFSSALLVTPINKRHDKIPIICGSLVIMAVASTLSVVNPYAFMAYVLIVPFFVGFGVYYPTIVTMFSGAVDASKQGWVMGVTVALYTLGAGIMSLLGGGLMSINIHLPFVVSVSGALISLVLIFFLRNREDIQKLSRRQ